MNILLHFNMRVKTKFIFFSSRNEASSSLSNNSLQPMKYSSRTKSISLAFVYLTLHVGINKICFIGSFSDSSIKLSNLACLYHIKRSVCIQSSLKVPHILSELSISLNLFLLYWLYSQPFPFEHNDQAIPFFL